MYSMPGSRCCSTPSCCVGIQNPIVCAIDPSRAWNPLGTGFTSLQASSRAALSTRGEYMGEINRNNDASAYSATLRYPVRSPGITRFHCVFPQRLFGPCESLYLAPPTGLPRDLLIALTIFPSKGTTKIQTHDFGK